MGDAVRSDPVIPPTGPAAVGVGAVLLVEFVLRNALLPTESESAFIAFAVGVEWGLALLLALVWIPRVEGLGRLSIGLTPWKWRYAWLGAAVFFAQLAVSMLLGVGLVEAGLRTLPDLQPPLKGYGAFTLACLFTAGFLEELFYRGYLIERVTVLAGSRRVALGVSWGAFTLVHLRFFGVGPTLQVAVLSASLVWLYARERSVWPCLVTHGINSTFAYILFPAFG